MKVVSIDISDEQLRKFGKEMESNVKDAKTPITFFPDFLKRVTKGKDLFSEVPLDGVEFPFGDENGDISKPFSVPFNDYNIHAYLGGRTGMGKSNCSNVGINAGLFLYSPDNLEIYYMDFKEAEGAKYKRNITPHFKCIATTSDAGYLLSLFKHIDGRMRYRQNTILPMYNAGKLKDIREKYEDYIKVKSEYEGRGEDYDAYIHEKFNGDEDKIREFKGTRISEIVIVIDEFTEGLKAEPEVVKQILAYIDSFSRLGRATGVHLFLMSQDIPDKLDPGTLGQIVTRLSLPVSTGATSKTLVGNESAADPDYQTKGNLLFNDRGGDLKANVRMKVPIIQPEDMDENLSYVRDKAVEMGYKINCVLFDHNTPVLNESDLIPFLKEKKAKLYDKSLFLQKIVIGDNVEYTSEPAPVGFDIGIDEGENIWVMSQSSKKRIEIVDTVVANFAEVRGDKTNLYHFKGNKDFNSNNISEKYSSKFKDYEEIESVHDLVDVLEHGNPIRNIEKFVKSYGLSILETEFDETMSEDKAIAVNTIDIVKSVSPNLIRFIEETDLTQDVSSSLLTKLAGALRTDLSSSLIVIDGMDRITGLGFGLDYSLGEKIKDFIMTAPYYGVYIVASSAVEPQSFSKLEGCFRHRLVGTPDLMSKSKFRFIVDAPKLYGGYSNLTSPDGAFKYKIYNLPEVKDDVATDNRVLM